MLGRGHMCQRRSNMHNACSPVDAMVNDGLDFASRYKSLTADEDPQRSKPRSARTFGAFTMLWISSELMSRVRSELVIGVRGRR